MKFILLFLLLNATCIYAQDVSVVLSLDYRCKTPYLNITYRNNTERPIYFPKICCNFNEIPRFMYSLTIYREKGKKDLDLPDYSGQTFYVVIDEELNLGMETFWEVLRDTVKYNSPHEPDVINDNLADFYNSKTERLRISNGPLVLNSRKITRKYSKYFVFLKNGDTKTDSYNISGFQKLKGNYLFCINTNELKNFVNSNFYWDDLDRKLTYKKIYLPEKVGRYQLFSGEIETSDLEVEFK